MHNAQNKILLITLYTSTHRLMVVLNDQDNQVYEGSRFLLARFFSIYFNDT